MVQKFGAALILAAMASAASAAVVLQEDFTPAQAGTVPAGVLGEYDSGSDVSVVPLATMVPSIPSDHTGGDGHVLRVGDIGSGGGAFNWVMPADRASHNFTDSRVGAWIYIDWASNGATNERDYLLYARRDVAQTPNAGAAPRRMYMFAVTDNSSWSGLPSNPVDFKPFIMVRKADGSHAYVGTQGAADVTAGWHYFELICQGSTITGKIDGATVVSGTDTTWTSGYTGVGYYDDNNGDANNPNAAAVDNLLIEDLATAGINDWSVYE